MITDGKSAMMTRREFDDLPEYSRSLPTLTTTIGKRWKRRKEYVSDPSGWLMGEYEEHPDPRLVSIRWREILEVVP